MTDVMSREGGVVDSASGEGDLGTVALSHRG